MVIKPTEIVSNSKPIRRTVRLENAAKREGWRPMIHSPSGSKYTGNWHDNDKHGVGEYINRRDWLFSGYFEHNRPVQYGVSAFGQGRNIYDIQYRGEWKDGHFHGEGMLHFRDGSIYKGHFVYSMREGYGQMWYRDGSYYEGDWVNNLRHGEGFLVEPTGNRFEGIFNKGLKHGRGVFYHLHTGQYMSGIWEMDICKTSIMADIPFRQTGLMPTEYTINEIQLDDVEKHVEGMIYTAFIELESISTSNPSNQSHPHSAASADANAGVKLNLQSSSVLT